MGEICYPLPRSMPNLTNRARWSKIPGILSLCSGFLMENDRSWTLNWPSLARLCHGTLAIAKLYGWRCLRVGLAMIFPKTNIKALAHDC